MTDKIGLLLDALENVNQEALIFVDNKPPTALSSWRGVYRDLAIETDEHDDYQETRLSGKGDPFDMNMAGYGRYTPGHSGVEIEQPPTVGEFCKALNLAIGEEFEGYKGGQYTMWRTTTIWVCEYGRAYEKWVDGVEDLGDRVDLVTKEG